jgi:tetratricopeptide (TPR) repeat protein
VEKSLVMHQSDTGASRYRLLETIRQYAGERLEDAGEAPDARARHLAFFVGRAEEARPALRTANAREWLDRLERDHDNFRTALAWALDSGAVSASLRLVISLYGFWLSQGYWREGQAHLAATLARVDPSLCTLEVANALNAAGQLAFFRADLSAARRYHERALAIRRELADPGEIELQLNNLAQTLMMQGEYPATREVCEEALAISRKVGNKDQAASALCVLGKITYQEGNVEGAWPFHQEALALRREVGYKGNLIFSLCDVGLVFQRRGEFGRARQYFEEALEVSREAGLPSQVAQAFRQLGELAVDQRDYERARHFLGEARALRIALGALPVSRPAWKAPERSRWPRASPPGPCA